MINLREKLTSSSRFNVDDERSLAKTTKISASTAPVIQLFVPFKTKSESCMERVAFVVIPAKSWPQLESTPISAILPQNRSQKPGFVDAKRRPTFTAGQPGQKLGLLTLGAVQEDGPNGQVVVGRQQGVQRPVT